ncbi:MAG: DMT family transporter [Myxococcales bacterium]|nr:DMT family transporter [Myxococcales bacterium]
MAAAPLMTALIGYLVLSETLGWTALLGMLLTLAGVAWALPDRNAAVVGALEHRVLGVCLALVGAFGQGLGLVLSKHGMGTMDAFEATQIRAIAAFVSWTLIMVLAGRWASVGKTMRDLVTMRLLALGAFTGPVIGVSLSLFAVKYTHAGVTASIMSTTPILLIPVTVIFFRERVGIGSVLGTVLAVGSVVVLFLV